MCSMVVFFLNNKYDEEKSRRFLPFTTSKTALVSKNVKMNHRQRCVKPTTVYSCTVSDREIISILNGIFPSFFFSVSFKSIQLPLHWHA